MQCGSLVRKSLLAVFGVFVAMHMSACSSTVQPESPSQEAVASANNSSDNVSPACGLDGQGKEFFGRWIAAEGGKGSLPAPGELTWSASRSSQISRDMALGDIISVLEKRAGGDTSKAILSWAKAGGDPEVIPLEMDVCLSENGWTIAGRS